MAHPDKFPERLRGAPPAAFHQFLSLQLQVRAGPSERRGSQLQEGGEDLHGGNRLAMAAVGSRDLPEFLEGDVWIGRHQFTGIESR